VCGFTDERFGLPPLCCAMVCFLYQEFEARVGLKENKNVVA